MNSTRCFGLLSLLFTFSCAHQSASVTPPPARTPQQVGGEIEFARSSGIKIAQCYTRTYSDEHLKKNPKQMARAVKLVFFRDNLGPTVYGLISVTHKDADGSFTAKGTGACTLKGQRTLCGLDEDAGTFRVKNENMNTALLTVERDLALEGFDIESDKNEIMRLVRGSTNGVYRLKKAPISECTSLID